MIPRCLLILSVMGSLLILSGCDPGALVKSKVPDSLKDLLTSSPAGTASRAAAKIPVSLNVANPKQGKVYTAGDPVAFQAEVNTGGVKLPAPPAITWQLIQEGKPPVNLGTGAKVSKPLVAGKYEVQATADVAGQKVFQKVGFLVSLRMVGTVTGADGKPLDGTTVLTMSLEDEKVISQTQSEKSGSFMVEFPADQPVIVKPQKSGFSFSPLYLITKFTQPPTKMEFKGVDAEISNMRVLDPGDSSRTIDNLCPDEPVMLSFALKSSTKPASIEGFLVQREKAVEQVIPVEEIPDSTAQDTDAKPNEPRTFKFKLPSNINPDTSAFDCRLRLTIKDETGNTYSAQAPQLLRVDLIRCFERCGNEAVRLLEAGKVTEAVARYDAAEKLAKNVEEPERISSSIQRLHLNRGTALLIAAVEQKPGTARGKDALGKSLVDFNAVLKQGKDSRTLFLRGLGSFLLGNFDAALKDSDELLGLAADSVEGRTLRAFALIKTGLVKNLSQAVDDLTQIIQLKPDRDDLRKLRTATLKLCVQYQDRKDGGRVDTGDITLPDITSGLDLKKYLRK